MHRAKRLFDVAAVLIAVPFLLPLISLTVALRLLEGGPILFSQVRIGRNGRRFRCWKFRTMCPDAEVRLKEMFDSDPVARAEWARYQKLRNDPRVTPIGRFLRRTSLDELPQLFNVLRGDMSLVGPRPIVAPDAAGYLRDKAYYESSDFNHYTECMPGITGLWQVSGRSGTTYSNRIDLDRWYAQNRSLKVDLLILLRTLPVVFGCIGSA